MARKDRRSTDVGRRPLIAGNWKMNMTHLDAIGLVQKLAFTIPEKVLDAVEVVVLPPFTALRSVQTLVTGDKLDVGPLTVDLFTAELADARTVFWNGPMGVFELAPFQEGTRGVAAAVGDVDGLSVVGGGDSAAAVRQLGLDEQSYGHISTGGGASLEYLEGRQLPGLAVLAD